ncbi:craniofacial development protein 2-like [Acyrthosiphon pisum]|uniref:Uncharacterized protein n=1 Tax=Acyrthosiphon pisum TaxID=7029 RepID=A0A8R2B3J5_ACYPI|nr:craniofacial development protein 2-like [Acyrthosiphon pisum]|eukprot:XP_008179496.1 PREDICTED: craniofacial development protein 2-like [Acyrthosiphon pisum]
MAMSKELVISSTYFPRKNIHKHTWVSPNGLTKNQIDHAMISKKHMSCISNVRSYRGADADTDHYLIIAHFRIRLSSKWKRSSKTNNSKFNVEILRDQEIAKQYEKLVQKEIGKNSGKNSTEDIENQWNRTKQIITDCASVHISNIHEWVEDGELVKCEHAPLSNDEQRNKLWINQNSESHDALKKIITAKDFIKDLAHAKHFIHTGSFQSENDVDNMDCTIENNICDEPEPTSSSNNSNALDS